MELKNITYFISCQYVKDATDIVDRMYKIVEFICSGKVNLMACKKVGRQGNVKKGKKLCYCIKCQLTYNCNFMYNDDCFHHKEQRSKIDSSFPNKCKRGRRISLQYR